MDVTENDLLEWLRAAYNVARRLKENRDGERARLAEKVYVELSVLIDTVCAHKN